MFFFKYIYIFMSEKLHISNNGYYLEKTNLVQDDIREGVEAWGDIQEEEQGMGQVNREDTRKGRYVQRYQQIE